MSEKKLIKETTEKLLNLMGFSEAEIKISEKEDNILVNIKVEDQGVLIGYHGETINALQLILSLIIYRETDKWQPVLVDIGDYRQEQEERLTNIALSTAQKVKFSQKPISLVGLRPFERRMVHMALAEHADVYTQSEGEGMTRKLIVYPKKKS